MDAKTWTTKITQIPMFQSKWDKPLSQLKFQNLLDNVKTESQMCSYDIYGLLM